MRKRVRLDKLLAVAGYGSRKEIKKVLRDQEVTVNGAPVHDAARHIEPDTDVVAVNGETVSYREFIYLMLNKPAGYVSATEDSREQTVLELVPPGYRVSDLFPVGRLDKDTEGLLLLTNDGKLAHQLLSPRKHIPKTYFVRVDGLVGPGHAEAMTEGIVLDDGYKTKPAHLKILQAGDVSEVELTIYEGKFHQVKRMFGALGMAVLYLKRISMGSLSLDPRLAPGQARELEPAESEALRIKNSDL